MENVLNSYKFFFYTTDISYCESFNEIRNFLEKLLIKLNLVVNELVNIFRAETNITT